METKVEKWKSIIGLNVVGITINNRSYSIELFDDETNEERFNDFMFEYGVNNEDAKKAFELMKAEF